MNRHERRAQRSQERRQARQARQEHRATTRGSSGSSWRTTAKSGSARSTTGSDTARSAGEASRSGDRAARALQGPRYSQGQSIAGKTVLSAWQTLENDRPVFAYLFRAETKEELSSSKTFKITEGMIQALHLEPELIDVDCFAVSEARLIRAGL